MANGLNALCLGLYINYAKNKNNNNNNNNG